jgi:hypothetical protein
MASFATCLVRPKLNVIAAPGQLNRYVASLWTVELNERIACTFGSRGWSYSDVSVDAV